MLIKVSIIFIGGQSVSAATLVGVATLTSKILVISMTSRGVIEISIIWCNLDSFMMESSSILFYFIFEV